MLLLCQGAEKTIKILPCDVSYRERFVSLYLKSYRKVKNIGIRFRPWDLGLFQSLIMAPLWKGGFG